MARAIWYCEASVASWNAAAGDYDEVYLEHYSAEPGPESAADDARETWIEHGYNPERVKVRRVDGR
jgi:hypothetical protein